MARLGDNPIKSPLAGNELIPATDPSDNTDICLTPAILRDYIALNLPIATATGNGLFSAAEYARLYDTYTIGQIDAKTNLLKQEALGFFVGVVADGYIEFMKNPINDLTIRNARFCVASGTVTCSVQINGVSVTGLALIAVTSAGQLAAATALNFLPTGARLGLLFASNAAALNFYISIYGEVSIP